MKELVDMGGSDLHLTAETLPYYRLQGDLIPFRDDKLIESNMYEDLLKCWVKKN